MIPSWVFTPPEVDQIPVERICPGTLGQLGRAKKSWPCVMEADRFPRFAWPLTLIDYSPTKGGTKEFIVRTYLWIQETDSSASMNKGTCLLSICTESHAQESASFCVPTFRSAEVRSNTASINKLASFSKIFDFEEVALLFQALLLMGWWSELAAAFQLLLSGQQTPGEKRNSIAALSVRKWTRAVAVQQVRMQDAHP